MYLLPTYSHNTRNQEKKESLTIPDVGNGILVFSPTPSSPCTGTYTAFSQLDSYPLNVALNTTASSMFPRVATVFTRSFQMGGLPQTSALELGVPVALVR